MENFLKKSYSNKKVLITGGLGLIGSNLAHQLVRLGAKITILDAFLPNHGANLFNLKGIKKEIRLVKGDIRDEDLMKKAIKNKDYFFNLAGLVSYSERPEQGFLDLDINCQGQLVCLEACRKYNPEVKIIFSGSRMQFGRTQYLPVDEKHPTEPLTIYGIHKLTAEKYHLMYHHLFGLKTIICRIANPYGPRQQMKHSKYGIVNWFIRLAIENQTIPIFGTGNQIRDYFYIDDLVKALLLAGAKKEAVGQVFNLGSGQGTKFIEMARTVIKVVGQGKIKRIPWPKNYFVVETGDYIADISKAKEKLNWQPKTSLEEGIRWTYEYYKRYKKYYW